MEKPGYTERELSTFLRKPITLRRAVAVIVVATFGVVVVGGILMRLVDGEEYPNIWKPMWWALQTTTTVGYGDVTPQKTSGRIVGVFVMLAGVAYLTVVIAVITASLFAREQREREADREAQKIHGDDALHARFDALEERIGRIEAILARSDDP